MHSTSAVEVSIQATSPLFGVGAGAAAAAASGALAASAAGAPSFFCSAAAGACACASETPGASALRASAAADAAANKIHFFILSVLLVGLERVFAGFAGADANDLLEVVHEDLPVADLSGAGRAFDRLDRAFDQLVADSGLDFHLRQEVDDVLRSPIQLR